MYQNLTTRDEIWNVLEVNISNVLENPKLTKTQCMELYSYVHNYLTDMSLDGRQKINSDAIALNLYRRLVQLLRRQLLITLNNGRERLGEDALIFYSQQWIQFEHASRILKTIFGYLSRTCSRRDLRLELESGRYQNVEEIYPLTRKLWREIVFEALWNNVTNAVLEMIERDRNGEVIDTGLVKTAIKSYVDLGREVGDRAVSAMNRDINQGQRLYIERFETRFLQETEIYYRNESQAFLEQNSLRDYIQKIDQRFLQENTRVEMYLESSTLEKLMTICNNVLVTNHMDFISAELSKLFDEHNVDEISRMYMDASRVESVLNVMCRQFEKFVYDQGVSALKNLDHQQRNDPKLFVEAIMNVYEKYSMMVEAAFKNEKTFVTALKNACFSFTNRNDILASSMDIHAKGKSAELLARYWDSLLKKSSKNSKEDQERDDNLERTMVVFEFIGEKDLFESFYKKLLWNRLSGLTTSSYEAEALMISRLKRACGANYTHKLQQLFQDVTLSQNMNELFLNCLKEKQEKLPFKFEVKVLTFGHWSPRQFNFVLPYEVNTLEQSVSQFTEFHCSQYPGRRLQWMHNVGRGEMSVNCFDKRYVFQVSTFQMAVLLQFNSNVSYRVGELAEATKLDMDILVHVLRKLVKANVLLLPSAMKNDDPIENGTILTLFQGFKNKKSRVNLNMPLDDESKIQLNDAHSAVYEGRKFMTQSAIIRVMKMRKLLEHSELVAEVTEQLASRFSPDSKLIKSCLETLIDREFLERVKGGINTYSYLA